MIPPGPYCAVCDKELSHEDGRLCRMCELNDRYEAERDVFEAWDEEEANFEEED